MSAIEEVTFRVEGYDDKAVGSCAEEDMDVFGRKEQSGHPVIVIRRLDVTVG